MSRVSTEHRLEQVAERLVEGEPVAWQDVCASLPDEESSTIAALQAIGRLLAPRTSNPQPRIPVPTRWAHLHVLEPWGDDGMSFVAADHSLGQEVLLTLVGPLEGDEGCTLRLLRESRALARVRHPQLATLLGADYRHDFMGYWTQLIRGRHLADRVAEQGMLDYAEACHVCLQVCSVLDAIHTEGLVHGNVTPTSVLHTPEGRVIVRPIVFPRQQLANEPARQEDIRAVGALLLFLMTGSSVPEGRPIEEAVGTGSVLRSIPKEVSSIVVRANARSATRPFADVRELAKALDDVLNKPTFGLEAAVGIAAVLFVLLCVLLLSL